VIKIGMVELTSPRRERLMGLSALLCATSLASSIACGVQETGGSAELGGQATDLRLYVLDCGTMTGDPVRFRLQPEEVSTTDMSTPCYLVSHPEGTLLWDTGAVPDQEWTPTGSPVAHHLALPDGSERDLTLRKPLLGQLAELGYAPEDITYLALSHYHWDHVANANAFASATWLVREVERDTMFAAVPPVTLPRNYARLKDSNTIILENDDHDVFGDGTVVIKSAPGHTPGHQVLYLRLQRTGDVLLSGDVYHFRESRTLRRVPTFDVDQEQTPVTREAIEAFLADTGAQLWIQHDAVGNALLKKSPQFYD
jgi:glyoxylase-like metal-dependent hydrolase (beta-lactamase superfamily II)